MLFAIGFILIVSIIFFIFARISSSNDDFGQASVYIAIGLLLLFIDLVLFIALIKVENLFEY